MIENNKFNKILTVLLIIIFVAIVVVLGFFGFDFFQKVYINANANEAIEEFDNKILELQQSNNNENIVENTVQNENNTNNNTSSGSSKSASMQYKGYDVIGKIQIPKTKLSYPVLSCATVSSMKVSVGVVYGPGLNEVGNTVLMGHTRSPGRHRPRSSAVPC